MRLSRIVIKNFGNFSSLDVRLGQHAVVLGENKVGKTNLLFALRLILDPSLPDSARRLRLDDFWDGLERPLKAEDVVEVTIEFSCFEDREELLAVLADHLVRPDPMVARITYRYQPIAGLDRAPRSEADYEFIVFGGGRPDNTVGYEVASLDADGSVPRAARRRVRPRGLGPFSASAIARPARQDRGRGRPEHDRQGGPLDHVEDRRASGTCRRRDPGQRTTHRDGRPQHAIETALGFAPTDPERMLRALQMMIDGGASAASRRQVSDRPTCSTSR